MSKTETVETVYGTVEIETVDCDSCGETIAKADARRFVIGDGNNHPQLDNVGRKGYACEYCAENGPIGFPERVREFCFPADRRNHRSYGLGFHIGLAILLIPVITFAGFTDDAPNQDFANGYATAITTVVVYGLVIGGLWWLL